jgi:hypothetical protein
MYVCVYVCMYYVCVCVYVCMYVCVCMCVCMYLLYLGIYVFMPACVCVYVCMCIYVCVYFPADSFTGRTTEKTCFNFHQGKEIYFLFRAPRGPLEPTQFLHLSGTGYSSQGVKAAKELTTCT